VEARDEFIARLPQWIRRHGPDVRKALEVLERREALVWDNEHRRYAPGEAAVDAWLEYAGRFEDRVLSVVLGEELERLAERRRLPRVHWLDPLEPV
jgi:hypothetical protein